MDIFLYACRLNVVSSRILFVFSSHGGSLDRVAFILVADIVDVLWIIHSEVLRYCYRQGVQTWFV
jgi:hypothetical protein